MIHCIEEAGMTERLITAHSAGPFAVADLILGN